MGLMTREHHARVLYINVPLPLDLARSLTLPEHITPNGWLSIVISDLDRLDYFVGCFVPTFMRGYMAKVNLLGRASVPLSAQGIGAPVPGYQILHLSFESGLSGCLKKWGAVATQRVPAINAIFKMSDGPSGNAKGADASEGARYGARIESTAGEPLVQVEGTLAPLDAGEERQFAKDVVVREHKFLVQRSSGGHGRPRRAVYSDERGVAGCKASFSADGVMALRTSLLDVAPLLRKVLGSGADQVDASRAVCFVQPEYIMYDSTNTLLGVEQTV